MQSNLMLIYIGGGGNGGNSNGTGGTGSKHSRSLSAGSTTTATKSIKHSQSGPLNSLPETEDYSDEITISDGPRSAPVDGKAAGKFPFLRKQNSDLPVVAPAPSGKHKRRNTTTAIPDSANASNSGNTLNVDDELLEDAPDMEDSWRSNLTDDEFERLTAQERRRQDVIWELISTERDYVRDLKIIIYVCIVIYVLQWFEILINADVYETDCGKKTFKCQKYSVDFRQYRRHFGD
jgi:hypothetical protein